MDWILPLIKIILDLIGECSARDGRETVKRRLLRAGFSARLVLYRLARASGKRGGELRAAVAEGMEYLRQMTPEEADELLDEAADRASGGAV